MHPLFLNKSYIYSYPILIYRAKKRAALFIILLSSLLFSLSCTKNRSISKENPEVNKRIDDYVSKLMKADEIPGMAIAVIQNGQIIHKKYYGLANIAHQVPVTDSTLFRIYSTSKLITSIAIFQLIETGKLFLDDPISKHINDLPELWKDIKIEHLLTHSSGLPDYKHFDNQLSDQLLISKMANEPLHFENGYQHEYNQTNFWFLQLIIEKVTNQKFEDFIKENQFSQNHDQVIYASNSLVAIPNRVAKYEFNKEYNAYEISSFEAGNRSLAGNGLNTNLNTLIAWNSKLDQNQLINEETKVQIIKPYEFKNQNISFGYSWGLYGPKNKQYYGFAGGGVSAFMKFMNKDLTIIILSNGFKNRPVISKAITHISGLSDTSLVRADRMLNEDVRLSFMLNDYNDALKIYKREKTKNNEMSFERALTEIGYYYLSHNKLNDAISIFRLVTEEYPNSFNGFDSLAEAYFIDKKYKLSKENYEKSLDLNPANDNARKMIVEIEKLN